MAITEVLNTTSLMYLITNGINGNQVFTTGSNELIATRSKLLDLGIAGLLLEQKINECPCGEVTDETPRLSRFFDVNDLIVVGFEPQTECLKLRTVESTPFRERIYSLTRNTAHIIMATDLNYENTAGNST